MCLKPNKGSRLQIQEYSVMRYRRGLFGSRSRSFIAALAALDLDLRKHYEASCNVSASDSPAGGFA